MIYGAMLAGGVGSRMKSAVIPKQFLEVDGKPIIIYTLQNMLKVDRFDYIYIATHKDYLAYMKEMVQKYTDKPEKVRIIEGGKERMDSIHNVTDAILKDEGVHEDDVIVIHDACGVASIASELAMHPMNYLLRKLGIPCNSLETEKIATDKYLMRCAMKKGGVDGKKY